MCEEVRGEKSESGGEAALQLSSLSLNTFWFFLSKEHNHVMKESKTKTITSPPQYKTQAALTSRKNGVIKNSSSSSVLKLS